MAARAGVHDQCSWNTTQHSHRVGVKIESNPCKGHAPAHQSRCSEQNPIGTSANQLSRARGTIVFSMRVSGYLRREREGAPHGGVCRTHPEVQYLGSTPIQTSFVPT